ncbi:MAG: DnaJ domain-containing protein [Candidatus Brocadiae bacterium]|nr:DnaJ domain-containing protein [Candidatus Brocadiia bacterium]
MSKKNPFDVLGLKEDASQGDVKQAYFQLVKQFSPEKHGEKFKEIREAYDVLKDADKRLAAEVLEFTKPPEIQNQELDRLQVEITTEVFYLWWKKQETDLEKTNFTGDFQDV